MAQVRLALQSVPQKVCPPSPAAKATEDADTASKVRATSATFLNSLIIFPFCGPNVSNFAARAGNARLALLGIAANIIARYIERHRWIAWVGLVVILYVAGKMIWEGWHDVQPAFALVG